MAGALNFPVAADFTDAQRTHFAKNVLPLFGTLTDMITDVAMQTVLGPENGDEPRQLTELKFALLLTTLRAGFKAAKTSGQAWQQHLANIQNNNVQQQIAESRVLQQELVGVFEEMVQVYVSDMNNNHNSNVSLQAVTTVTRKCHELIYQA